MEGWVAAACGRGGALAAQTLPCITHIARPRSFQLHAAAPSRPRSFVAQTADVPSGRTAPMSPEQAEVAQRKVPLGARSVPLLALRCCALLLAGLSCLAAAPLLPTLRRPSPPLLRLPLQK